MNANNNSNEPRRPEMLAGYADGELSAADRAAAEAWIATDTTTLAELDVQQRLSLNNQDLWNRLTPSEPSDAAWSRVLAGIHDGVKPATPAPSYRTDKTRFSSQRLPAAAAIALGLLIAVGAWYISNSDGTNPSMADGDILQMVHADDVTIMDVWGDDSAIVIGRSPLTGAMDLVTIGDTEFWAVSTDPSETPTKPILPAGDPHQPRWFNPANKMTPVP